MMKCADQTADILSRILTDVSNETIPGVSELSEFIHQQNRMTSPILKQVNKDVPSRPGEPAKKRGTYYLTQKVCVELSEAKAKIKVHVPPNLKRKVSMSKIVDFAVKAILDEFNQDGKDSPLVEGILSDIRVD